MLKEKCFK